MPLSSPAVVVVAYGSPDLLRKALSALPAETSRVVVDNSQSAAVAAVARAAGAHYVAPERNVGFAAGVNLGLAHVEPGRDVLLLNPDASLSWTDVLRLVEELQAHPRRAAVAPGLARPDGTVERSWWPMPDPWLPWRGVLPRQRPQGPQFLNGAVLLLSGAALEELGGFDERYFLYAEECDWQRRALAAGWTVALVADVTAEHVGAATSSDPALRDRLFHASAERYIRKWFGARGWRVFRAGSLAAAVRRLVFPGLWRVEVRRAQRRAVMLYLRGPVRVLEQSPR